MSAVLTQRETTQQRLHYLAGLRGFELPEDDSSNSHQLPENGPTTLAAFTPIRQVFQSDGQNAMWRFESSHPSQISDFAESPLLSASDRIAMAAVSANRSNGCRKAATTSPSSQVQ